MSQELAVNVSFNTSAMPRRARVTPSLSLVASSQIFHIRRVVEAILASFHATAALFAAYQMDLTLADANARSLMDVRLSTPTT